MTTTWNGTERTTMITKEEKVRLTSQELCELYGVAYDYNHAARTARKLVLDYNLPYIRVGYSWVKL